MTAGESAEAESKKAAAIAKRYRQKAAWAERRAESFEKGAGGESIVAAALEPLERRGWTVLHDLTHPNGGNIDHIAIGPPGVAVIDAKNWTAPVTVRPDRHVVISNRDVTDELDRLEDTADRVRSMLKAEGASVAVRGYLVLTGDADRSRAGSDRGDLRIIGVDNLAKRLDVTRVDLDARMIEDVRAALEALLPSAIAKASRKASVAEPSSDLPAPSSLFDRAHRFYYLKPWKRGAHHRLYLRSGDGEQLGWADVNTGAVSLECSGSDAKLAKALLEAADPTGVKLSPGDLPKVPTRLWGGRLLALVARAHTSVLIGQEWRGHGKHRLYGTLIDPEVSNFALGYIDIATGEIRPAIDGDIAKDRGSADRYLAYIWQRWPGHEPPAG